MDSGIKMRWEIILRNYLEYLSEKYEDKDIDEKFRYIIENLDSNEFKNRVLLHDNEVVAYSFLVPSRYRDRDVANIGFMDKKFCNGMRSNNLVNWILLNSNRIYTVLDDVFNDSGETEKALSSMNFKKIVRKKMCIKTGIKTGRDDNINYSSYEKADLSELCDADPFQFYLISAIKTHACTYLKQIPLWNSIKSWALRILMAPAIPCMKEGMKAVMAHNPWYGRYFPE